MFDRFEWWHAVLIFVVANVVSSIPAGIFGDDEFYTRLRTPPLAPPGWAFPVVWVLLNMTSLWALYRVANLPVESSTRSAFLISETAGWIFFATFTTLYFGMRSLTLGAVDTVLGLLVAAVSLWCASRLDIVAFGLILPRVLWLTLASYVSVCVAAMNRTPV